MPASLRNWKTSARMRERCPDSNFVILDAGRLQFEAPLLPGLLDRGSLLEGRRWGTSFVPDSDASSR